jgi:hypothetical protein
MTTVVADLRVTSNADMDSRLSHAVAAAIEPVGRTY